MENYSKGLTHSALILMSYEVRKVIWRQAISSLDINTLTPVEALMKLNEIKKIVGGK